MYFSTYINFGLNWFSGFKKEAKNVQKFTTNVQQIQIAIGHLSDSGGLKIVNQKF